MAGSLVRYVQNPAASEPWNQEGLQRQPDNKGHEEDGASRHDGPPVGSQLQWIPAVRDSASTLRCGLDFPGSERPRPRFHMRTG